MNFFYTSILLLLIISSSSQAQNNNMSLVDNNNSSYHFALSGGYSPYSSEINLYAEKSLKSYYSMLLETTIDFNNEDYDINFVSLKTYLLNYYDEGAYLFEGFYYYGALDIDRKFDFYNTLTISPSVSIGYGWHYFNHSLVFAVGPYVEYQHSFWRDKQTGDIESWGLNAYGFTGTLAYIF